MLNAVKMEGHLAPPIILPPLVRPLALFGAHAPRRSVSVLLTHLDRDSRAAVGVGLVGCEGTEEEAVYAVLGRGGRVLVSPLQRERRGRGRGRGELMKVAHGMIGHTRYSWLRRGFM